MKKRRRMILGTSIAAAIVILLICGLAFAFLVDKEEQDNVITIGNVSVKIDESNYTDTDVVSQSRVDKAPKLVNDGSKDEYVFVRIRVPKDNVTLLYETDTAADGITHKEGTPIDTTTPKKSAELFKLETVSDGVQIGTAGENIDFSYHKGDNSKSGWYLLPFGTDRYQEVTVDGRKYDEYVFGYNKMLSPGGDTVTVFDRVQLKSFIDQEIGHDKRTVTVDVFAYAIQADNLGLSLPGGGELMTVEQVTAVYDVVKRKQVM